MVLIQCQAQYQSTMVLPSDTSVCYGTNKTQFYEGDCFRTNEYFDPQSQIDSSKATLVAKTSPKMFQTRILTNWFSLQTIFSICVLCFLIHDRKILRRLYTTTRASVLSVWWASGFICVFVYVTVSLCVSVCDSSLWQAWRAGVHWAGQGTEEMIHSHPDDNDMTRAMGDGGSEFRFGQILVSKPALLKGS